MATLGQQTAVLDELQKELNLVLERLGRMFAALNANPKVQPIAQKEQLKREIPAANNRFQLHLDELEDQLHDARQTLRRDLALCREREALQARSEAPVNSSPIQNADQDVFMTDVETTSKAAEQVSTEATEESQEAKSDVVEDIKMESSKPILRLGDEASSQKIITSPNNAQSDVKDPPSNLKAHDDTKAIDASDEINASAKVASGPPGLSLDTATEAGDSTVKVEAANGDGDTAPETANTDNNTADLDSLFNGPLSASGDNDDFGFDQDNTGEIDFGSFAGDNDNISSLLPGLQDYANPQFDSAGATNDFDSMFDINTTDGRDQPTASVSGGEQEAFNFEDFMNSNNFDANGNITSIEGGDTNDGNGSQEQFDFDALFD